MKQDNRSGGYYDYALLCAFTNFPYVEKNAKGEPQCFKKEIEGIFENHKSSQKIFSKKANPENTEEACKIIFKPVIYWVFGNFDLAVFSLIDDFGFASKKFKPKTSGINFKYQVNTGIIPRMDIYTDEDKLDQFLDKEIPGFFAPENPDFYPFNGITSLKLNNAMLVGVGQNFVLLMNFFLIQLIDNFKEKRTEKDPGFKMHCMINENLGWNELTVYSFSNDISAINELTQQIRKTKLDDILSCIIAYKENQRYQKPLMELMEKRIVEELAQQSLLNEFISTSGKRKARYLESHPFIAASTVYGYHIDHVYPEKADLSPRLETEAERILYKKQLDLEIISMTWNIKPGHEENANESIIKAMPKRLKKRLTEARKREEEFTRIKREKIALYNTTHAGKYSYVFPDKPVTLSEYIELIHDVDKRFGGNDNDNIINFKSSVNFENPIINYRSFDKATHFSYSLKDYEIKSAECEKIVRLLRVYPIAHIIKSQIENLILNYNDAITDPLMYNYFIGLRAPLINFLTRELGYIEGETPVNNEYVDDERGPTELDPAFEEKLAYSDDPLKQNTDHDRGLPIFSDTKNFTNFIEAWNKGYWNRHFHGYYFTEINDFNIEHHGGIQQILFAYDVIYKTIAKRIYGKKSLDPFVIVRIDPFITAGPYHNTINFTHLFKPAIYACECVYEAANTAVPYLIDRHAEFSFLSELDGRKKYTKETEEKINQFERDIRTLVGPKDEFEVRFIENFIGINSIRYLFTDFISFKLAYDFDNLTLNAVPTEEKLKIFYHTRWFLFLPRADLYLMNKNQGSWYFNEDHFKYLFIRFNLMFHLMCGLDTKEKLEKINEQCPSSELKSLWDSYKDELIDFVLRLGKAMEGVFKKQSANKKVDTSLKKFKKLIFRDILLKNTCTKEEMDSYDKIIKLNFDLINEFFVHFSAADNNHRNSIIRSAINDDDGYNIGFYEDTERDLFLDPKGNIFLTSEVKRKKILKQNTDYLKALWDIAMKASIRFYKRKKRGA